MNKARTKLMVAAAITGLLAGTGLVSAQAIGAATGSPDGALGTASPGVTAPSSINDQHSCKGKNDCKGQGGCSSSDNGCKGKNSCKGKGGCSTQKSN
jgi:hypothetical protein